MQNRKIPNVALELRNVNCVMSQKSGSFLKIPSDQIPGDDITSDLIPLYLLIVVYIYLTFSGSYANTVTSYVWPLQVPRSQSYT